MCRVVPGTTTALGPVLTGQSPVGQTDSKQTNIGFKVVINAVMVIKRKSRDNVLTNTGT